MGRPVEWVYLVVLEPGPHRSQVLLYRAQKGTSTRFLWAQCEIGGLEGLPDVDHVVQELYTGILALMEVTC